MEINKQSKRTLRLQGWIFNLLFLASLLLIGWLSTRYDQKYDWTATGLHSLTEASIKVLDKLDAPIRIHSYASEGELRDGIKNLIERYQQYTDQIELIFIDPMKNPDKTRDMGIRVDGEMVIHYQERTEHLQNFSEESITNTIQRLLRNAERHIVFVTGHGERDPTGQANYDLSLFSGNLQKIGFQAVTVELPKTLAIPQNTSVLVIASPLAEYLAGELKLIQDYVKQGGNLLWLTDPQSKAKLAPLAEQLQISFSSGTIVDTQIQLLGVNDPTIVMGQYQPHPITNNFDVLTLYPRAVGIQYQENDTWQVSPFLQSIERSWVENGKLEGTIAFDQGIDIQGPVQFGLALQRDIPDTTSDSQEPKTRTQRIVVMGDGDFIANAYLGNQANQAMGENIINWLTHDDSLINIPPAKAADAQITLSETSMAILGAIYMLLIPIMLIGGGVFIWLKRRKR